MTRWGGTFGEEEDVVDQGSVEAAGSAVVDVLRLRVGSHSGSACGMATSHRNEIKAHQVPQPRLDVQIPFNPHPFPLQLVLLRGRRRTAHLRVDPGREETGHDGDLAYPRSMG